MLPLLFFLKFMMIATSAWTFPDGRCYVNDCNASPYDLTWNSVNLNNKNELVACFNITDKTCIDNSKYNCCNSFRVNLSGNKSKQSGSLDNFVFNVSKVDTKI